VHNLEILTRDQKLYEVTSTIIEWVRQQRMQTGLLTIFCRHTSASLLIQENADPTVRGDIEAYFRRLAPENGPYDHGTEGPDDMPAHLKTALTQVQLSIPVIDGSLVLGAWQGIYLFEHRTRPHRREIVLHLIGE
jgi:secondary thiamine-phosphate synthase enzyme